MTTAQVLDTRCRLIECGSKEAWLRERASSIGASDAAAILGGSPWRSKLDVYAEKVGALDALDAGTAPPSMVETEEMTWGNALEEPIAQQFQERTKLVVSTPTPFTLYRPSDLPIAHATPDRFLINRNRELGAPGSITGLLEIKTTSAWNGEEWETDAPLHVMVQIQQQMWVLGLTWGFVTVLIGGQKMRYFEVAADLPFHELLAEEISRFWKDHVEARVPPAPSCAGDAETVKRMFKRASEGVTISLPAEFGTAADELESFRSAKRAAEAAEKQVAAKLQLALGEAEVGLLPDGRRVSWKNEDADFEAKPAHAVQKRVLRVIKAAKGGVR